MKPTIRELKKSQLDEALFLIRTSFATAARKHGLTPENCPAHTGFITLDYLTYFFPLWQMYGLFIEKRMVGFMALHQTADCSCELRNLCVHPEYRGRGLGRMLVEYAKEKTVEIIGHPPTIVCPILTLGFIDEDRELRAWYETQGFVYTGSLKFEHLPFTSGYMEWRENPTGDSD